MNIAIATITWARNEAEENLLKESLTQLAKINLPVYITDAGSTENFVHFLSSNNNFKTHDAVVKGVWPQAKCSLEMAINNGAENVLYTEPDKLNFFIDHLPTLLANFVSNKTTGMVLFSRSKKAFATFPSFQQTTETVINNCCAELIGNKVDYAYGPFFIRREIIKELEHLPGNIGWGWRPYAFNIAKRAGYNIDVIEGDFFCPQIQRDDSPAERIYRMKQLTQNIEGLLLSTTAGIKL